MLEEFPPDWFDKFLGEGGFPADVSDALRKKVASLRQLAAEKTDTKKLNHNAETRIAYRFVEIALPGVRDFLRQRLLSKDFGVNILLGRINNQLLERLADWIPPDAYVDAKGEDVPSDFPSILNVGWLRWIVKFSSVPAGARSEKKLADHLKKVEAMNRLVLKAIEYVDFREEWGKRPRKRNR
jgi:hypothetical protein